MTKNEFIMLDLSDKMQLLWNEGEIVTEKRYYESNITLFLLESFYVEVFFDVTVKEITAIEIQDNAQILYAYVTDVSLKELENLLQR
jgi:hypothetical protein